MLLNKLNKDNILPIMWNQSMEKEAALRKCLGWLKVNSNEPTCMTILRILKFLRIGFSFIS
jgi:hypothetical protein